jgi:antitoxin (DNA-binding transcriptional repressor) of toxin-antitoxin stability system
MATIHISEADAVRDFAAVLEHVRSGSEVVIEGDGAAVAVLVPPTEPSAASDPEHDAWFRSEIQHALEDERPGHPAEEVEARFAARRAASLRRAQGSAE